jgi:hypothetical protein
LPRRRAQTDGPATALAWARLASGPAAPLQAREPTVIRVAAAGVPPGSAYPGSGPGETHRLLSTQARQIRRYLPVIRIAGVARFTFWQHVSIR